MPNFISGFQPITSGLSNEYKIKRKDKSLILQIQGNRRSRTMKTAQYTKSLTVSLRPEVYDRIKRITDEKHISIGEWVREAIEIALSTIKQKEATMK